MRYKYTYKRDDKIIVVNHSLDSLKVNIVDFYLKRGYEVVKIEIDGNVLFEKK